MISKCKRSIGLLGLMCFLGAQSTLRREDSQSSQGSLEHQERRVHSHRDAEGYSYRRQLAFINSTATAGARGSFSSCAISVSGPHAMNPGRALEDLEADTSCDPPHPHTKAEALSDSRLSQLTKVAAAAGALREKKASTAGRHAEDSYNANGRDGEARQLRWVNGRKVNTPPRPRDRTRSIDGGSEDRAEPQQPSVRARPPPGRPPPIRETGMNTVRICSDPMKDELRNCMITAFGHGVASVTRRRRRLRCR